MKSFPRYNSTKRIIAFPDRPLNSNLFLNNKKLGVAFAFLLLKPTPTGTIIPFHLFSFYTSQPCFFLGLLPIVFLIVRFVRNARENDNGALIPILQPSCEMSAG